MNFPFVILALVIAASAIAAMSLRNLVHCALCLVITFAGLAGIYLQLGAEFVGFAQILVYVGAVAILVVYAILLTRSAADSTGSRANSSGWAGLLVSVAVFGSLAAAITSSVVQQRGPVAAPQMSVAQIGDKLLNEFVIPLEVIGLLLTAAMIGAVIIAMQERRKN